MTFDWQTQIKMEALEDRKLLSVAISEADTPEPADHAGATLVQVLRNGVNKVHGLGFGHAAVVAGNGKHVYVASYGDNAVSVFARNQKTGKLTLRQVLRDGRNRIDGLERPTSIVISNNGRQVYVTGRDDNAIAVFGRNPNTGKLARRQVIKMGMRNVEGLEGVQAITLSADGKHAYAASLYDESLVVLSRNKKNGKLKIRQVLRQDQEGIDGLQRVRGLTVSPDGAHVYVAATDSDSIAIFNRDAKTGHLVTEQVMRGAGLDGASDIRFSADGRFAYVASEIDDNLVVYSRSADTGRLSHVQTFSKSASVGLEGPFSVTLSKDGQRVFVASHVIGEVSIFARDAATGRVEFLQLLRNGLNEVEGVAGAFSAAPSPEGKFLYVTGTTEDSLAVFSLNEHASQPVKKKK